MDAESLNSPLLLAILQRANTGILVVDQKTEVIFCNFWLKSRCQWSHKQVIGNEITRLFPRFSETRLQKALSDALQFGISSTLSHSIHGNIFPLSKKSGDPIHHTVLIQSIRVEGVHHALIEVTDVTSPIKRERLIRKAQQDAEAANHAKEEFLAAMSHELRTPLTTIIGNSELLSEQEDDPLKQELVHTIEISGRAQLALVNDILDMSKIESGKFTIDSFPFNLSTLLHDIEHLFAARAYDLGLDLLIKEEQPENHLLIGDGQRIQQILINLVSNALKFTDTGSVTLTTSRDQQQLVFTVQDTGIGIDPETQQRLFQRFEQADNSMSRRFGGSGLGLYISNNLATLMGGEITVSSQADVGSTFTVRLPYQRSDIPADRTRNRRAEHAAAELYLQGEVLVAEDTLEIQLLVKRILENMGITVTIAGTGPQSLELANRQPFDMILMDMQMPEIDGIEVTRQLRSAGNETPIVALTANVMQKHRDAFSEAGCNAFLSKPIDKYELQQILKQYLQEHASAATAPPSEPVTHEDLVHLFETTCTERRELLINASAEKNWIEARGIAHTIKGSCGNFNHAELEPLSKTICDAIDNEQLEDIESHVIALVAAMQQI